MPETRNMGFWHPSGMLCFFLPSGGAARQTSLNHRLISDKPPACPGDLGKTALPKFCRLRNISKRLRGFPAFPPSRLPA
jgi:hypothetical protein